MDKQTARNNGLKARAGIPETVRADYNTRLLQKMIDTAEDAELVGCYVSMKDEADTRAFLDWCFRTKKPAAVLLAENGTLSFHRVDSFADLHPGVFGVMEPSPERPVDIKMIDLMFVPLSAFDESGNRTGYGRGYYDSVLASCRRKIGIAFPEQKTERIEPDPWDIPLDAVLLP